MPKPDITKDYYGILELKSDANADDVKRAYHKLGESHDPPPKYVIIDKRVSPQMAS